MKRKADHQLVPSEVCDLREDAPDPQDGPAEESPPPRPRPGRGDPVAESAHLRATVVRWLAEHAALEPAQLALILEGWADALFYERDLVKRREAILKKAEAHGKITMGLRTRIADWE